LPGNRRLVKKIRGGEKGGRDITGKEEVGKRGKKRGGEVTFPRRGGPLTLTREKREKENPLGRGETGGKMV